MIGDSKAQTSFKGLYCELPFTSVELHLDSKTYLCCPQWTLLDVGDYKKEKISALWNSKNARDIREAILDGSYKYCNKNVCPQILGNSLKKHYELDKELRELVSKHQTLIETSPRSVMFSFDPSCNLSCPSCRPHKINYSLNSGDHIESSTIIKKVMAELFLNPQEKISINITGSGDPFSAIAFRQFLEELDGTLYPNLRLDFQTNGLLLTPITWERIKKIHKNIGNISVSIDAATAATYSKVRRGGDWNLIMENMKFLSDLRFKKKKFPYLIVNFVVQQSNYREMAEFVKIFTQIKVDRIFFSLITDWNSMPKDQFLKEAIYLENHPDHQHFLNVLADPIFDLAELGNLKPLRTKALQLYSTDKNVLKRMDEFRKYKLPLLPMRIKKILFHFVRAKIKNN